MTQICAWCQHEGQQEIYEQRAESPLGQISHGICPTHALRLRQTIPTSPQRPLATSAHS